MRRRRLPRLCKRFAPTAPKRPSVDLPLALFERLEQYSAAQGITKAAALKAALALDSSPPPSRFKRHRVRHNACTVGVSVAVYTKLVAFAHQQGITSKAAAELILEGAGK